MADSAEAPQPLPIPEDLGVMTRAELAGKKGEDGAPICIAVCGLVYDVSAAASFYGPGGPCKYGPRVLRSSTQ